jgi:hypothetical protein
MSLVARGLGLGSVGALVAAGLGLNLVVVVPEFPAQDLRAYGDYQKVQKYKKAEIKLSAELYGRLEGELAAAGGAIARLVSPDAVQWSVSDVQASGSAQAVLLLSPKTSLGNLVAQGKQDISEEELLALLAAILQHSG